MAKLKKLGGSAFLLIPKVYMREYGYKIGDTVADKVIRNFLDKKKRKK